jgi:hypothetical protein
MMAIAQFHKITFLYRKIFLSLAYLEKVFVSLTLMNKQVFFCVVSNINSSSY